MKSFKSIIIQRIKLINTIAAALILVCGCNGYERNENQGEEASKALYILNEGSMGENNASLSCLNLESGNLCEDLYAPINGTPLGDVANDIIVTEKYMIIAINASNIIEFCSHDGKHIAGIEAVPACRKLAVDPAEKNLFVTSWANGGEVVKLDLENFSVKARVKVGYEPEGIAYYNGRLYVANSGGNAYLGDHGYEKSISVVDAASMREIKRVDTGMMNLYGAFVQNDKYPQYLLVNACGDYGANPAGSFIFDCENERLVESFNFPSTYAAVHEGIFYTMGSNYDWASNSFNWYIKTININASGSAPGSASVSISDGIISDELTGTIKSLISPYGIHIDNQGKVYLTDAVDYKNRGLLYRFDKEGRFIDKQIAGVCPGHFAEK